LKCQIPTFSHRNSIRDSLLPSQPNHVDVLDVIFRKQEVEIRHPGGEVRLHWASHQQQDAQRAAICRSSGLRATNLLLLPRRLQLPVPFRVDLLLPAHEHGLRA
jgi:hypothetical protein